MLCFSNDGTEFAGSIYQKVNSNLETAVNLAWTAGSNNTRFGIGAKYQLDKDTSLNVSTGQQTDITDIITTLLLKYWSIHEPHNQYSNLLKLLTCKPTER